MKQSKFNCPQQTEALELSDDVNITSMWQGTAISSEPYFLTVVIQLFSLARIAIYGAAVENAVKDTLFTKVGVFPQTLVIKAAFKKGVSLM
jgi:hypothetical protein